MKDFEQMVVNVAQVLVAEANTNGNEAGNLFGTSNIYIVALWAACRRTSKMSLKQFKGALLATYRGSERFELVRCDMPEARSLNKNLMVASEICRDPNNSLASAHFFRLV